MTTTQGVNTQYVIYLACEIGRIVDCRIDFENNYICCNFRRNNPII